MAKKKAAKVNATKTQPETWAIRLDLTAEDHGVIEEAARWLKVSKAAYARMAVMERARSDVKRSKE